MDSENFLGAKHFFTKELKPMMLAYSLYNSEESGTLVVGRMKSIFWMLQVINLFEESAL